MELDKAGGHHPNQRSTSQTFLEHPSSLQSPLDGPLSLPITSHAARSGVPSKAKGGALGEGIEASPTSTPPHASAAVSLNTFLNNAHDEVGGETDSIRAPIGSKGPGGGSLFRGDSKLGHLIESKERELHEIHNFRIRSLEGLLEEREQALADAFARYDKLKDDFKFNLSLIEGRDAELERYEVAICDFKETLRDKEVEVSELRMQLDEALSVQRQAARREEEQQGYWQAKCKDIRAEADSLRWAKEDEGRRWREQGEATRTTLTRQLREREDDLERQRAETAEAFDQLMRQREEETRNTEASLRRQLEDAQARAAEVSRGMESWKQEATRAKEEEQRARALVEEEGKVVRRLRWEMEDRAKIAEAEREEREGAALEAEERHERSMAKQEERLREVLASLHAVENAFVRQKAKYEEEERGWRAREEELQGGISSEQDQLEELKGYIRGRDKAVDELKRDIRVQREQHEEALSKVKQAMSELKGRAQLSVAEASRTAEADRAEMVSLKASLSEAERGLERAEAEDRQFRREAKEAHKALKQATDDSVRLEAALLEAETRVANLGEELVQSRQLLEDQDKVGNEEQKLLRIKIRQLEDAANTDMQLRQAGGRRVGGGGDSPLFSGDQGPASPLPNVPTGLSPPCQGGNVGVGGGGGEGGIGSSGDEASRAQELSTLQLSNRRLRAVIADMRREMEVLQGPPRVVDITLGQNLGQEREEWRREGRGDVAGVLVESGQKPPVEIVETLRKALATSERELERLRGMHPEREIHLLQKRCKELESEVDCVSRERDQLMDISNSLRASLNRVQSQIMEKDVFAAAGEGDQAAAAQRDLFSEGAGGGGVATATEERELAVKAAVSRVRGETRRKYRARIAEVEEAFQQLAADNRRLKARVRALQEGGADECLDHSMPQPTPAGAFISGDDGRDLGTAAGGAGPCQSELFNGRSSSLPSSLNENPSTRNIDRQGLGPQNDHKSTRINRVAGGPSTGGRRGSGVPRDSNDDHRAGFCDGVVNRNKGGGIAVMEEEGERTVGLDDAGREEGGCVGASGHTGGGGIARTVNRWGGNDSIASPAPAPPPRSRSFLAVTSSARQTDGQREVAERLRARQESRRRGAAPVAQGMSGGGKGQGGKVGVVRGVRNYNIVEDG